MRWRRCERPAPESGARRDGQRRSTRHRLLCEEQRSMKATIRHGAALATVVFGLGIMAAGCLTRPVEHADPVTKTNVTIQVPNAAVDKIDMLFDIDNSASMGDKQAYLFQAIPLLIQ